MNLVEAVTQAKLDDHFLAAMGEASNPSLTVEERKKNLSHCYEIVTIEYQCLSDRMLEYREHLGREIEALKQYNKAKDKLGRYGKTHNKHDEFVADHALKARALLEAQTRCDVYRGHLEEWDRQEEALDFLHLQLQKIRYPTKAGVCPFCGQIDAQVQLDITHQKCSKCGHQLRRLPNQTSHTGLSGES